jgi:Cysteine rich repeat
MAVVCRIARWSLSIAVLFAAFAAVAQTDSAAPGASGGGKFRAACDQDLQRFCVGVQPGRGRLVECLSAHTGALSTACGTIIAGRGGGKFRAACDQDLQRFCVGVKAGGGRLVQCLSSHTSELSAACGNRIAAILDRRDTSNPSAQSSTTQPAAPVTVSNSPAKIGSFLRASCGPDVQRLCAGARRESEALNCLASQRMQLSTTCTLYFQNLGARSITQKNALNKKLPSPPATSPIPAQENASNKQPPSPPATPPIPAQENASNKQPPSPQENASNKQPPSPSATTPIPTQENAKQPPSLPPTKPVPFPD